MKILLTKTTSTLCGLFLTTLLALPLLTFEKVGQQAIPFVDQFFDNVVLTEDMRLGEPGMGWKLLMKKLEFERCLVVAQALGQAQAVMNEVGPYCSERICFQKPIGHLSAIQQHLVEMETILTTYVLVCTR